MTEAAAYALAAQLRQALPDAQITLKPVEGSEKVGGLAIKSVARNSAYIYVDGEDWGLVVSVDSDPLAPSCRLLLDEYVSGEVSHAGVVAFATNIAAGHAHVEIVRALFGRKVVLTVPVLAGDLVLKRRYADQLTGWEQRLVTTG